VVRVVGSNWLIASAHVLSGWRIEHTPIVHNLRGIAWTGTRWVAVGDVGSILYRQGGSWIAVPNLPNSGLRGTAARPGLLAAAGSGGVLLTSTDAGLSWRIADSGTAGLLWGGVRVGSALLFSGQNSTVITSQDGITWSPITTSPLSTGSPIAPRPLLWQLAASGAEIVAVGDFGAILEGTLARSFRRRRPQRRVARLNRPRAAVDATPSGVTQNLDAVAWTVKHFLASGEDVTIVSSDGRSWREVKVSARHSLRALAPWRGLVVAVGDQTTHAALG
jgi:hypothetical protein